MALSELQKRKLKVEFQSYDLDGDGAINQDDFEGLAAQIARVTGIKSGASEYEQLKSEYQNNTFAKLRGFNARRNGMNTS
ncbi:hypothetical protein [Anabaena subtropica]|uniref:EF-hand domain-containing protein n=1 Tax=Anabaena subtropica FACHB-260 TaxID=2692884 RepID=A0ABR8CV35_9NOST|nr:hypothetical protein [Anabaena subtropica]MBD2347072.1 hypothetical protein [Anabaena subtropica FACHB-260]